MIIQAVLFNGIGCPRSVRTKNGERNVHEGNYTGSSKGMEAEAVRRLLDWLEHKQILPLLEGFVIDQDSSVDSLLANDARVQGLKILLDPGTSFGGCLFIFVFF